MPRSQVKRRLSLVAAFCMMAALPGSAAFGQPESKGQWDPPFEWPNVAIHLHVLPTGNVLFFSRRELGEGLDPHNCTPRIWNPQTGLFTATPQPGYNLFCSGHTFLADGRLLVAGGHISDNHGEPHASIYDPFGNTWTQIADMPRDPAAPGKGAGPGIPH